MARHNRTSRSRSAATRDDNERPRQRRRSSGDGAGSDNPVRHASSARSSSGSRSDEDAVDVDNALLENSDQSGEGEEEVERRPGQHVSSENVSDMTTRQLAVKQLQVSMQMVALLQSMDVHFRTVGTAGQGSSSSGSGPSNENLVTLAADHKNYVRTVASMVYLSKPYPGSTDLSVFVDAHLEEFMDEDPKIPENEVTAMADWVAVNSSDLLRAAKKKRNNVVNLKLIKLYKKMLQRSRSDAKPTSTISDDSDAHIAFLDKM